jgi:hypothetical protein
MVSFRCIPIPTEGADRFRSTGIDDRGNAIRRVVAVNDHSCPCRVCLRYAREGEVMLLGSYDLPRPRGVYWTPSPIFVRAEKCTPYGADGPADPIAPIVSENALVSVRAYDAEDQCLYDLGHVCDGHVVAAPLDRAMGDPRTAFVNVHTARPGCLLARVERTN